MTGMRAIRIGLLILLSAGLAACAGDEPFRLSQATPAPYPPPDYAHRVATSHVVLYYNCVTPSPGGVRLDGVAFNPWSSQPVGALQFELVGVDTRGRPVSEAKTEARDFQLATNQSTPFQLDLKTAGNEVRFDLYYSYQFDEGDHKDFEMSKIAWRGPILLTKQTNRFFARDACSATAHLAR